MDHTFLAVRAGREPRGKLADSNDSPQWPIGGGLGVAHRAKRRRSVFRSLFHFFDGSLVGGEENASDVKDGVFARWIEIHRERPLAHPKILRESFNQPS